MKFILQCVGCCRTDDRQPEASPWREETPFLVVPDRPIRSRHRNRKRGRDWRPSLSVISEDDVDTERVKKRIVYAGSETRRKGKISPGATTTRSHVGGRYNGGESGGYGLPAFMPSAFPSPFMF